MAVCIDNNHPLVHCDGRQSVGDVHNAVAGDDDADDYFELLVVLTEVLVTFVFVQSLWNRWVPIDERS